MMDRLKEIRDSIEYGNGLLPEAVIEDLRFLAENSGLNLAIEYQKSEREALVALARAESKLAAEREKYQKLVEAAKDVTFGIDPDAPVSHSWYEINCKSVDNLIAALQEEK